MAQTTLLAAGKTVATSSDLTVASGASVTLGLFTDEAVGLPPTEYVTVFIDTPGLDREVFTLSGRDDPLVISGPGVFRATRGVTTVNIGIWAET